MADESFQHAVATSKRVDQVWEALDRPTTWEAIPGVDHVHHPVVDEAGRLRGFSFDSIIGGRSYRGQALPSAREEGSLIGWDITSAQIQGQVVVAVSQDGDGSLVDVRLDISRAGFLGALLFPIIASAIRGGFERTVEEFVAGL